LSFSYIDANKGKFIKNLSDAVAIKSVSCWADHRQEYVYTVQMTQEKILIKYLLVFAESSKWSSGQLIS
jgi:hypothetical protein